MKYFTILVLVFISAACNHFSISDNQLKFKFFINEVDNGNTKAIYGPKPAINPEDEELLSLLWSST